MYILFSGEQSTEPFEQRKKVSEVHIHPEFNPSLLDNDFSLLKLESKIEATNNVSPVCLPEDATEDFGDGTFAIATGWGREASKNGNKHILFYTYNRNVTVHR